MRKQSRDLCTFCSENQIDLTKTFNIGEDKLAFCSNNCAEQFVSYLPEKDRKLISINQCCSSPRF